MPRTFLAFDLGATSSRALLGRLDDTRLHTDEVHRFPTPLVERHGRLIWDVERIEREVRRGLDLALEQAPDLASLSVDSWAVDYVPLGPDGRTLRPPYAYRDARTDGLREAVRERVPDRDFFETTGIQFLPFNTVYQVLADVRDAPEEVARTHDRLTIADYLHYRLCGRAVMDASMASTTQLRDARSGRWARALMERAGVPTDGWPEIVPCGTVLGPLAGHDGVRVVAGCSHDTACAVAAVPADETGGPWAYVSSGTWSLMGTERAAPLLTDAARRAGFTNEVGLGGTIRFLKNLTGLWALQECMRAWGLAGPDAFDRVLGEAERAPSTALIDLEDPRFTAPGSMEERLRTYCREQGLTVPETRGELVRAILESIADSYRRTLEALERVTGERVETLHVVGGGARNALLCRLTAQACAVPVVAGPAEATAVGNLLVQARTLGALPAGAALRDVVRASTPPTTYAG